MPQPEHLSLVSSMRPGRGSLFLSTQFAQARFCLPHTQSAHHQITDDGADLRHNTHRGSQPGGIPIRAPRSGGFPHTALLARAYGAFSTTPACSRLTVVVAGRTGLSSPTSGADQQARLTRHRRHRAHSASTGSHQPSPTRGGRRKCDNILPAFAAWATTPHHTCSPHCGFDDEEPSPPIALPHKRDVRSRSSTTWRAWQPYSVPRAIAFSSHPKSNGHCPIGKKTGSWRTLRYWLHQGCSTSRLPPRAAPSTTTTTKSCGGGGAGTALRPNTEVHAAGDACA